jgi:hypothetical protein
LLTWFFFLFQAVSDKRTALYNKLVASYHKAKTERSSARQLEVAQGAPLFFGRLAGIFLLLLCPIDALTLCRLVAAAAQVP